MLQKTIVLTTWSSSELHRDTYVGKIDFVRWGSLSSGHHGKITNYNYMHTGFDLHKQLLSISLSLIIAIKYLLTEI